MNTRISADLSQLAKIVQKQKEVKSNLTVSIIIPICVGFNKSTDEKRQGHLQNVITALNQLGYSYQVRLYKSPSKEDVSHWENLNRDGLNALEEGNTLFHIKKWRKTNLVAREKAKEELEALFMAYPTTKAEFDKKIMADAGSFIGRKSVSPEVKAQLLENAKEYIFQEIIDCLAALTSPDSDSLNIFLYPDAFYSSMQLILKENALALNRMPIISSNYTIPKQVTAVASSSASSKPVPIASSSSGSSGNSSDDEADFVAKLSVRRVPADYAAEYILTKKRLEEGRRSASSSSSPTENSSVEQQLSGSSSRTTTPISSGEGSPERGINPGSIQRNGLFAVPSVRAPLNVATFPSAKR
ncbi:MAG: hypothetical protein WAW86_02670 [Gammaproteobacteria bacterium]